MGLIPPMRYSASFSIIAGLWEDRPIAKSCHKCGGAWVSERRIPGRTETCAGCEYDLYCCLNCKHYAPGRPNDCMSPTVELVFDKEKANFCGEFEFANDRGPETEGGARQKGRDSWDSLFGDD